MTERSKISLDRLLSIFANFGVLVGILFLIMEIQQANRIATTAAEIEIRSLFSGVNEAAYAVPGMDALLVKAHSPNEVLTPEETIRFRGYVLRLTNTWLALEIAYTNQLLPGDTYSVIEDDVRGFIQRNPLSIPIFQGILDQFQGQRSRQVFGVIQESLIEAQANEPVE